MTKLNSLILSSALALLSTNATAQSSGWDALLTLAEQYPNRIGGSDTEQAAAKWLTKQYQELGFTVKRDEFQFEQKGKTLSSANLEIEIKGASAQVLIVGAHYDAVPSQNGSSGFTDNASGAATLLELAKRLHGKTPYYTIRLVSFGAEEVGLQGSRHYVQSKNVDLSSVIGMINLDTVIGGDHLYIHSAHSKPYQCERFGGNSYSASTELRDGLLTEAVNVAQASYSLHPKTPGYPIGETGDWSDHAAFACHGIPIAYIEATNFQIHGKDGFDGYSQSITPEFWTCFKSEDLGACDRAAEKKWGRIWHTQYDQQAHMLGELKNHVTTQFNANVELLTRYILGTKP